MKRIINFIKTIFGFRSLLEKDYPDLDHSRKYYRLNPLSMDYERIFKYEEALKKK